MSAQTIHDAFAPSEALYRAQILAETWGHLAPKKGRSYRGHIVFAVGCFGDDPLNPTALDCEFRGLVSSPWFFEAISQFMGAQRHAVGGVFRFDGVFRDYEFLGTIRRLLVV